MSSLEYPCYLLTPVSTEPCSPSVGNTSAPMWCNVPKDIIVLQVYCLTYSDNTMEDIDLKKLLTIRLFLFMLLFGE